MPPRDNATVTLSQIAELAGVGSSAVSNWRKRFKDFPRPVETLAGGRALFPLAEIEEWLRRHRPERLDAARRNERLLFEAAHLLRGRMTADEGAQVFATAIAVTEAADRIAAAQAPRTLAERAHLVEQADPTLTGVFTPLEAVDLSTASHLLELTDAIDVESRADAFDWILHRRTRFVETRTSEALVNLLAELSKGARSILDPTGGEGGTLAAAGLATRRRLSLYGQEINETAWRIAKQRFLLRGLDVEMYRGDSLIEDRFADLRVDAVVCDPPYGMSFPREWRHLTYLQWESFGAIKARTADFTWLEHAISHLAEGGRGYVLLPAGTLFRHGREGEIRGELIRRGAVEAIVSLPPGSARHTAIPLALWIVQRPGVTAEHPVLLVDGAGTEREEQRPSLDASLIRRIVEIVRGWRENDELAERHADVAVAVSALELLGAEANLVPSRWIQPKPLVDAEERMRDVEAVMRRFVDARNRLADTSPELATARLVEPAQWVTVRELVDGEVAEIIRGVRVRPDDCLADGVRVLRTRDVRPSTSRGVSSC